MKIFLSITLFFISVITYSQVFVTTPQFPTETDSIIITFNIEEATNQSLLGYSGTLYTHTGVNTNLGNWQHVIGSWGDNTVQPSLLRLGANRYQIVINNPREFYGVGLNEKISSLNFVLRSSDGSKQTEDIFIPIYEAGLNVKIIEPSYLPFYPEINDLINIVAVTSGADSLSIVIENFTFTIHNEDTLNYSFEANEIGKHWINFLIYGNNQIYKDSTYFVVRPHINIAELPNNIKTGINYIDDNTVTLALFAPKKDFVYLIGDFNNWEFDPQNVPNWQFEIPYYMNLTPDSTTYWATITNLIPNEEYAFQYLVNGSLRIADPYTEKILDPWNDKWIPNNIYPNLREYPNGKTTEITSVFNTAQTDYNWQVNDFEKPKIEKLVIYEMWLRNFLQEHTFSKLIDTLSYLKNLGINAIELMPINEFEGNESWGYNPSFYFAVDKFYGLSYDFKRFVDECHKLNIAVIMDIVLNHSYGQSPLVRLYSINGTPTSENPWYNVTAPHIDFSWGNDFNHQSIYTQNFIDRIAKHWITNFRIDGFRYDFTGGFTNTSSSGGFDQSRIDILKRMADKIWEIDSTFYVILEHWTSDSEKKILSDYGMIVWDNATGPFNEATMGWNENGKSNFSSISYKNRGYSKPHIIGYMGSHDEERNMFKNLKWGNSINPQHNVKDTLVALNRVGAAAAFLFTMPGPKMLFQFEELGMDYSINWPSGEDKDRLTLKPFIWNTYYKDEARKYLYKTLNALIKLKTNYETFNTNNYSISLNAPVKIINFIHDAMDAVVIGNFDVYNQTANPQFTKSGMWYDYFSGDSLEIIDPQDVSINLKPGEYHIYTTEKLPTPEGGTLVGLNAENYQLPNSFELYQNYPNPFNPVTTIKYSIPYSAISNSYFDGMKNLGEFSSKVSRSDILNVRLKIYDILGREVATLIDEKQSPGNYEIIFDGKNLNSGIYFYKLQSGKFSEVRKMILLK